MLWLGITFGPCSPGVRHDSCSGEKRKQETENNEIGGVYRTFGRGIAFGRAYKEMREIGAKARFAYSETETVDNRGSLRLIGGLTLSAFPAMAPKNSNLFVIILSQVQALHSLIATILAPKKNLSPSYLFSPISPPPSLCHCLPRMEILLRYPAGSHPQQWYHHGCFLIGPTVI